VSAPAQVVRRAREALERGDEHGVLSLIDAEAQLFPRLSLRRPTSPYASIGGARVLLSELRARYGGLAIDCREVDVNGEWVLGVGTLAVVGRREPLPPLRLAWVVRIRAGRIVSLRAFEDGAEARTVYELETGVSA
jgi:ketosteroid isomerase-like protein